MTLNYTINTINTIAIKFYIEFFSPFLSISRGSWKEKCNWQSLTVRISFVRNNFIKNLLITKSSTLKSAFLSGQASRPYSKNWDTFTKQQLQYNFLCGNSANTAKCSVSSAMFSGYFKTSRTIVIVTPRYLYFISLTHGNKTHEEEQILAQVTSLRRPILMQEDFLAFVKLLEFTFTNSEHVLNFWRTFHMFSFKHTSYTVFRKKDPIMFSIITPTFLGRFWYFCTTIEIRRNTLQFTYL